MSLESELMAKVSKAIASTGRLDKMREAFRSVTEKMEKNAHRLPDLEERRERLARTLAASTGDGDMLARSVANLEDNGIRVRWAGDSAEAVRVIIEELGSEKLLVKSKSNLSREIDLARELGEAGIEVVETDIGDRVIQLSGDMPVHPTGPCAHLDRYDIARVLSDYLELEVAPEPHALIEAVRDDIAAFIGRARIGLIGVNAITALEGALVTVHNEGNIDLVSQRPDRLIVLASIDKVVPDLEAAMNLVKLKTYFATGQVTTAFIRVIGGPSRTADIEKELYLGVHGPKDMVVVMIDNGRAALARDEDLGGALQCVGCGGCLLECPVYDVLGPEYGSRGQLGGRGVILSSAIEGGTTPAVEHGLAFCTTCRNCVERCPVSLDTPALIERLRARATADRVLPLEKHKELLSSIRNYGNPYLQPRQGRARWARDLGLPVEGSRKSETLFFAGCSLGYLSPEVADSAVEVLRACGLEPVYMGSEEPCCGSVALRLGDEALFFELMRRNVELIRECGVKRVVTVCPGCLKAIRGYHDYFPDFDVKVKHISEVLAKAVSEGDLVMKAPEAATVTYHDPCHLGRGCGIYDEPREVLGAIEGLELVEMERNRRFAACCGSGGGVKSGFPELAREIGTRRVAMAEAAGAGLIVTCCPWCEQNLADAGGNVRDLVQVVAESLHRTPA